MAEPSRKINKGRHEPSLVVVVPNLSPSAALSGSNDTTDENPLVFWSLHPTDPHLVDLTQLATGRTATDVTAGKHLWRGDFSGRPALIAELLPTIKYLYGFNRASSWKLTQEHLRTWWRVFEEAESPSTKGGGSTAPIQSVADLQIIHHHIAKRMGVGNRCHSTFIRIANLTRAQKKLLPLHWPSIERERIPSELPESWEIERIRHALKRVWFDGLTRIEATDAIQANLWGWKDTYFKERSKHVHEVYRAVIELTGHPLPSLDQVRETIEINRPNWMQPLSVPMAGRYPTAEEVRAAFLLCLMYTGWNTSTLYNLNVEDRFVEDHPTNPDYHVVYGFKYRGNSEHHCIGRNKRSDAPGTILRALVERTRPLRELVRKELAKLESRLAEGVASSSELNKLLKQHKTLIERVRSPWLYPDPHGCAVVHVNADNLNYRRSSKEKQGTYLSTLIRKINLRQPPEKQIRINIVPSDLRDGFIGFAYEFSNYSVLTAQIVAGHKSSSTTQIYLDNRRWKAHSAKTIHKFQAILFREIDERKSVDPTILRANMEWQGVTDKERTRLAAYRKNRTRIGVGCKDPTNPPSSIAPNHTGGGCRVQRCTLCPQNAILLPDSDNGIAMRVTELEHLRDNTPVTVWVNSSFPEELSNAAAALGLYDTQHVEERLAYWRREINEGRHKPIIWEGAY